MVAEKKTRARRFMGIACLVLIVGMTATAVTARPAVAAWTVTATDLGTLGGGSSQATAMNESGQIVGWASRADGDVHAFSWTAGGGMVDLGTLGGPSSYAADVNSTGTVVGYAQTATGAMHAFSWTSAGGMVDLATLGGTSSVATAVSDAGMVVGYAYVAGDSGYHAFARGSGDAAMTDLGTFGGAFSSASAVNAAGNVVGWATTAGGAFHAFSWTSTGGMADVTPAAGYSAAAAVNGGGQVVGVVATPDFSQSHAFSWTAGSGLRDLGTLGGTYSYAAAVSDVAQVVGWANASDGSQHAFSWTVDHGTFDLGTLGGGYGTAVAVNATGRIAGYSTTAALHQHAFSWDPGDARLVDLGTLGGDDSQAVDINASGQVAGWSLIADGSQHAALFTLTVPPPYERVKEVADNLPAAPQPFADAKARLGEALNPALWNSAGTALVYPDGMRFFDKVKQAVDRLDNVNTTVASKAAADLWAIADEVAAQSVDRASLFTNVRANDVNNAQRQLTGARQRWAVDHTDAFERLKQAWRSAEAAVR